MNHFDLAENLILITDCGSMYKAALKSSQTSAAISKKLSKLEEHLGIQLAIRNRKGITLTEEGQRYYHEVKQAITQLKNAELATRQLKIQPRGPLKVVANQFYAETKILPRLAKFFAKYPDIQLTLDLTEMLPDFNLQKMDILFGVSLRGQDNLVQKKIDETRYILCAAPTYLKTYGRPNAPSELLQHQFISHSVRKPNDRIKLARQEVMIKTKLLFNQTSFMIKAALEGLGIIWIHETMVKQHLRNKTLIKILENYYPNNINVYAYYAYQKYHDPKIQAFLNFFG